jgi:hypothetical protein
VTVGCQAQTRALVGTGRGAVSRVIVPLSDLAPRIREAYQAAEADRQSAVASAIMVGQLLEEARAQVPHGEWLSWLEHNTDLNQRTAQRYLRCAKHADELKDAAIVDLSIRNADRKIAGDPRTKSATRGGFTALPSAPFNITDAATRHSSGLGLGPSLLPPELLAQRIRHDVVHAQRNNLDLAAAFPAAEAIDLVALLRPFPFEQVYRAVSQLADQHGLVIVLQGGEQPPECAADAR